MPCQMRSAPRSTLTLIIPEDILEEPAMMVMVVTRSSAKAGIIAGMLALVHTFNRRDHKLLQRRGIQRHFRNLVL